MQLADYSVKKFDSPDSWRLTSTNDDSTEASFRIQGILCAFELPPVSSKIRYTNKTRLFLKQRVRLTGLSSEAFHKAMTACDEVYAKMSNHFPLQSTNPWQTAIYESHSAIDFNARYFTKRTDAPNESHLPFLQGVDPAGVLEKLRKHDLIHGPDNQVEYIQLLDNDSYIKVAPSIFEVGDLVEATISFIVLPIKDERYIIIPQLQVLTLLQKISSQRQGDFLTRESAGRLKRKKFYTTVDSDEDTRRKMGKMQIDGEGGDRA